MAVATTTAGSLIQLFLADPTLSTLVPSGAWLGQIPEEAYPLPYVVVTDEGQEETWYTATVALVRSKVRFRAFAAAAAVVGVENPAEAIGKAIRATLNEQNPAAYVVTKIRVLWVLSDHYSLTLQPKRGPADERVFLADMTLRVGFERTT